MMTPEEDLQARSGVNDAPMPDCRNCDHRAHLGVCEYEPGDRWVTGNQPDAPTVLMALPPCGCMHYEPLEASDLIEKENPESI
jgi:hypothetical protein